MDDPSTTAPHGGFTREEGERYTQRLVVGAFAGLAALAAVFTLVAVVANASIHHPAFHQLAASAPVKPVVHLTVAGSSKKGPDGKMHDAFTVSNFAVSAGVPVKLVIDNTDDQPHSISSPNAGVSIIVKPGTHTYTLLVDRVGRFFWYCAYPCDSDAAGWAMKNPGFMSGYITAA
jgi:Cupredoxin-like domain